MTEITNVQFGSGQVTYVPAVDPVPATSETSGHVTINNMGHDGSPAHYDVTFMITLESKEGPLEFRSDFCMNVVVPSGDDEASYREVESEAARQLAPMLRSAADQIESQVAVFDRKRDERRGYDGASKA